MSWLPALAVIVLIIWIVVRVNKAKELALRAAPVGSTRVEALKAAHVNSTVEQYVRAGWTVVEQSTAKSLGSQARVTITFRKED